jgi:hypothetical protein
VVEQPDEESKFLNGKLAYATKLRSLTIIGEGSIVDTKDFSGNAVKKLQMPVQFVTEANVTETKEWQPNKTANAVLKKLFGSNSKNYIGKKIKIVLEAYKDSYTIKIDELETMQINKNQEKLVA